jgi:hypothetical protein
VAVEELEGGEARAQRGGEENRDGCGEDQVRASAFYWDRREVEAPVAASMASHEGASYMQ